MDHNLLKVMDNEYPMGTIAFYGPDNRTATKLVAAVFKKPNQGEPDDLHRWISHAGDVRNDEAISRQVIAFFKRNRVKRTGMSDGIIGCPHEEGVDYPVGGFCPHCPYWQNRDRFTHEQNPAPAMSVQEILAALSAAGARQQPREALAAADQRRSELVEPLIGALEAGVANPEGATPEQASLFSYALYLFAKWREQRGYPLIIRWLSLPNEGAFDIAGDIPTQSGCRMLAATCDGNIEPIKGLILNQSTNEYCRAVAIGSLAVLVTWNELPRKDVIDYFLWLAREGLERQCSFVWAGLASTCADMVALEVFPELRRAFDEGLIDSGTIGVDELDELEVDPRNDALERFAEKNSPIEDVAEETSWWQCFQDDPHRKFRRDLAFGFSEPDPLQSQPAPTQPYRAPKKVGRNEPCPCGSGKKYKKCCGK